MVGEIKARELWDEICMSAWISGDPGVVFIDRVQASAPNPTFGPIESSNPCGEEFLEPYGSCNLGSINLSHFVTDTAVDWDGLRECVGVAVRFLDDVITVNSFPEEVPELRNVNLLTRRIGLGVMGWADMLDQLLIPYDSEEAIKLAARISRFITSCAWVTSKILAEEKGAFPLYEDSNLKIDFPVRNSSVTTIAPTGSISIIGGCSSGIEPHFDLVWTRKALWSQNGNSNGDSHQMEILECPKFIRQELERLELNPDEILGRAFAAPDPLIVLAEVGVRCDHLRTSHEVSPRSHVEMLAAWQSSITNSVSKTINMPQDATPDQISDAYLYSWALQCKAVTVYRDKSKEIQVLDQLKCPQCEGRVVYQDGCKGCISCGWSACDAPTMDPGNSDYLF